MENQNKKNFTIVSMDAFAQVLSQIPEGKIIRVSDLIRFFEKCYGKLVYLDFLPIWKIQGGSSFRGGVLWVRKENFWMVCKV